MTSQQTPRVLVLAGVDPSAHALLESLGYQAVPVDNRDPDVLRAQIPDADAVIARTETYSPEMLDTAKRLKIIARYGVGTDAIDIPAATDRGIWVTVAKGANNLSVAEHALTLLLACAKQLVGLNSGVAAGNWGLRDSLETVQLQGKTLGVVGLGAIGMELAQQCHAGLGMRIVGYDSYVDPATLPDFVELVDSFKDFLTVADAISLHVPANSETRGMFNAEAFQLMKPGAILVNTARGGIVDENALYEALTVGTLRAAGLDVFEDEPVDVGNPLFELSNFVGTPHVGGMAREARQAMARSAVDAIQAVLSGGTPKFPVNHPKG